MTIKTDLNYYPALTGLRAIAAYMVYIHHFNPFPENYLNGYPKGIIDEMHIGVTIFFVLSGFLITHRYFNKGDFSFKTYFVNRIARIYPIYFILTTFTFLHFLAKTDSNFTDKILVYLLNITFLRGYFENIQFSLVTQGWSLTVEETFYLIAPLIFIFIKKNVRFLFMFPLFLLFFGLILVKVSSISNLSKLSNDLYGDNINHVISLISYYGFFNSYDFLFNYTFFGRVCEFFVGIALAILSFKKIKIKISATYFGIFFILFSMFILFEISKKYEIEYGIHHPLGIIINTLLLPLFGVGPLLFSLINKKTIISKILGSKLFLLLGQSSFVFYLIHKGIISDMLPIIENNVINNLFHFVSIILISIIIYYVVEEPLNKVIRRLVK